MRPRTPLVPDDFAVPAALDTGRVRLRPLTVGDVVRDYDAVMSSRARVQRAFGGTWPDGLSLEQNLVDLGWHQKQAQRREAFAYTVIAADGERCLGCVYIDPPEQPGDDATVRLWVRDGEGADELDAHLESSVRAWLDQAWPFGRVAFPGR